MTKRLTKTDWLNFGLVTLKTSGVTALKADPMAKALHVSRGSFYWHFADIDQFKTDLLRHWQDLTTDQIIAGLESEQAPSARLKALMLQAFNADRSLERAVRAWAIQSKPGAKAVAAVDRRRIAYIASLLDAVGLSPADTAARAAFLYWAYLGQPVVMDPKHSTLNAAQLSNIAELILRSGTE